MITIMGELYSSKNSKQIINRGGRSYLIPSSQYNTHLKPLQKQLFLYRYNWKREIENACKPLKVAFKIYRKTKRRFDYINIIQGLADEMVRAGWLVDDNADEFIPVFEPYEVDKDKPRVEISIIKQ